VMKRTVRIVISVHCGFNHLRGNWGYQEPTSKDSQNSGKEKGIMYGQGKNNYKRRDRRMCLFALGKKNPMPIGLGGGDRSKETRGKHWHKWVQYG